MVNGGPHMPNDTKWDEREEYNKIRPTTIKKLTFWHGRGSLRARSTIPPAHLCLGSLRCAHKGTRFWIDLGLHNHLGTTIQDKKTYQGICCKAFTILLTKHLKYLPPQLTLVASPSVITHTTQIQTPRILSIHRSWPYWESWYLHIAYRQSLQRILHGCKHG